MDTLLNTFRGIKERVPIGGDCGTDCEYTGSITYPTWPQKKLKDMGGVCQGYLVYPAVIMTCAMMIMENVLNMASIGYILSRK